MRRRRQIASAGRRAGPCSADIHAVVLAPSDRVPRSAAWVSCRNSGGFPQCASPWPPPRRRASTSSAAVGIAVQRKTRKRGRQWAARLLANPHAISLEAANPSHAHEWQLFEQVRLPEGTVVIPGVTASKSNFIDRSARATFSGNNDRSHVALASERFRTSVGLAPPLQRLLKRWLATL